MSLLFGGKIVTIPCYFTLRLFGDIPLTMTTVDSTFKFKLKYYDDVNH